MESKTNAPSFTVSLRGYDRMEVDEYLDSLAEALGQVEQAEERVHGLQAHIDRLNARIAELEDRIRSDVPRSGALLGERIAILLRSAEETAADTVGRAEAEATELVSKAREEVAAAEDQARGAIQRGEEQARRVDAAARAEAAEIIAEAESRASTRTRQIEQWAEQVISRTRAEEARMLKEQQEKRERGEADLRALAEQREAVAASIATLRDQLGQALEGVRQAGPVSLPAPDPVVIDVVEADAVAADPDSEEATEDVAEDAAAPSVDDVEPVEDDEELPWPAAFRPLDESPAHDQSDDRTGEIDMRSSDLDTGDAAQSEPETVEADERDEFDTKFDAWVTGSLGPRHFRRL